MPGCPIEEAPPRRDPFGAVIRRGLPRRIGRGDGPEKSKISALAAQYQLPGLILIPEKQRDQVPAYLSAADVAIIPLKNLDLFRGALPSKMFDAWACELPVILSVDGEARRTLESANGGLFIPPEDPARLAEALLQLKNDPAAARQMGLNGRGYTVNNFSRQAQAEKLAQILLSIISD